MSQPPRPQGHEKSFVDTLIPAKNGNALLAYYLGLFSIFPCAGLVMGAVAFTLGRRGLQATKDTPGLGGATHAKVGIGCGAIGFVFNLALLLIVLAAVIFGSKSPQ